MRKFLVLAAACGLLAGCGGGKHATTTTGGKPDANGCIPVSQPITGNRPKDPPKTALDPAKTYDVVMKTNCGSFTIRLDPKESPHAAASFAYLVENYYYDQTLFHRIAVGFIIQAGDPTASGTGGPGYSTVDTPPSDARYTHGVVAMAKTGAEPAGTAGGQFFVVTAPDAGLTPDYAIIGKVIRGLGVVDRIGQLGNDDQTPSELVEIEQATLQVSG
jgi:peptidyl-prolyl cis-trans isomerase B (cyclophilin B)